MADILHPSWRDENQEIRYPFHDAATLSSSVTGIAIETDTFVDASIHPFGSSGRLRLAVIDTRIGNERMWLGDELRDNLASAAIPNGPGDSRVVFRDQYGRVAGLLVTDPDRLAIFSTWPRARHTFTYSELGFCADVCLPMEETGFRGFVMPDGSIASGDICFFAGRGLRIQHSIVPTPPFENTPGELPLQPQHLLSFSAVGSPFAGRDMCEDAVLFETPRFLKKITFQQGCAKIEATPNVDGNVQIGVRDDLGDGALTMRHLQAKVVFGFPVGKK